ncbi:nuclear pore complex subunit nup159 [Diplodia corticola]|uniref:Nuclear pore complex subunit nup159 n=1 Tax=Diplodia corticola TaxID=236234 RepID=A0A1J9R1Y1_9PEZI|nr:nuclear pore complex subunit nup159 [Diplodia corticola]OJD34640.1 nuclear pore complex subunit nup159 [Diplodia corticola]
MAFSMGGVASPVARQADDIEDIQTEVLRLIPITSSKKQNGNAFHNISPLHADPHLQHLGFAAISARNPKTKITNKLKLLPSPWRVDDLPRAESNLFAAAPRKGVVAAAGPDCLVIASADSIRAALTSERDESNKDPVVPFSPELTVSMPRLSQITFTSDEQYLVISAQQGGGLAIHEVAALLQKNNSPALQIGTDGMGVRALIPNPAPELAENIAVVTEKGQLMIASLKQGGFVKTQNGAVLKDNVSCATWSNKGKQLVAGLADGTVVQMKPDGSLTGLMPRPPTLEGDQHVSCISWLTNDDFFIVHAPTSMEQGSPPEMSYHMVSRTKNTQNYTFSKFILSACDGWGEIRNQPPHYFISRLRNWKPDLDDLVLVSSTGGLELGLITKSSQPLSRENPVTNSYVPTVTADDARKASMPSTVDADSYPDMEDSSPLGLALDLSSKEKVYKPISGSDIEWTKTPLPAVMVLNHEGYLNAWWIVYNSSVESGTTYEGLAAANGAQSAPAPQQSQPAAPVSSSPFGKSGFGQPAFGSSGFGGASPLGQSKSPWASTSVGSATSAPAFGQSAFGSASKPATPAFGKPAFGAPSQPGTGAGFGSASGLGQKASPWGSPAPTPSQIPKPSGGFASSGSSESGFAKFNQQSASPFGAAKQGQQTTFAALAANKPGQSAFSSGSFGGTPNQSFGLQTEPSFASTVSLNSTAGGSTVKSSSFGAPTQPSANLFGQKKEAEQPQTQESDMGDADHANGDDTPKEPAKPGPFGLSNSGFKLDSAFKGDGSAKDDLPKPETGSSFGSFGLGSSFSAALGDAEKTQGKPGNNAPEKAGSALFGNKTENATSQDAPKTGGGLFGSTKPASPFPSTGSNLFGKPAEKAKSPAPETAPLPPDFTKKPATKEDSQPEAAPLPPDFTKKTPKEDNFQPEDAPLPPDFTSSKENKEEPEEEDFPPIAGSPPVKVEKPESPSLSEIPEKKNEPALPPSAPTTNNNAWSFPPVEQTRSDSRSRPMAQPKSRSPSRSPVRSPSRNTFAMSTTPAGIPKHIGPTPSFPQPTFDRREETLRSPSPVRAASGSILSPGPRRQAVTIPPPAPISRATSRSQVPLSQDPVFQDLGDDQEFEATRAILSSSPRATKTLEDFYVHQDYAGRAGPSSVSGSVEQLYRDMQSMIDTVGLNAHHLAGFIKGHNEITHEGRSRDDLDVNVDDPEDNDWVLAEIEDLSKTENGLERSLDTGRVADVQNKIRSLIRLSKDVGQLRRRLNDVRKSIEQRRDPSKLAITRSTPLSEEQSAQQAQLRSAFAQTQKLLAGAEEGIVLLKTRISFAQASKAGGATNPTATPTAEAVENTIKKMTAIIEQKSGNLDVLENQLRKMRLLGGDDGDSEHHPAEGDGEDDDDDDDIAAGLNAMSLRGSGRFSREASPAVFATPPSGMRRGHRSRDGTPFSADGSARRRLFFTPDKYGSASPGVLRSSVGPGGSELVLRSVEDAAFGGEHLVGRDEVRVYVRKVEKKAVVKGKLKEAITKRGPRITKMAGAK